jgi:hypothetical protein
MRRRSESTLFITQRWRGIASDLEHIRGIEFCGVGYAGRNNLAEKFNARGYYVGQLCWGGENSSQNEDRPAGAVLEVGEVQVLVHA